MGNGALPHGPSYRAHPRLYRTGRVSRRAERGSLTGYFTPQQISPTDPDSRSMETSGRGSGVVGYNVQVAVNTEHHLIITHEVTNSGADRAQLANMAEQARTVLGDG